MKRQALHARLCKCSLREADGTQRGRGFENSSLIEDRMPGPSCDAIGSRSRVAARATLKRPRRTGSFLPPPALGHPFALISILLHLIGITKRRIVFARIPPVNGTWQVIRRPAPGKLDCEIYPLAENGSVWADSAIKPTSIRLIFRRWKRYSRSPNSTSRL